MNIDWKYKKPENKFPLNTPKDKDGNPLKYDDGTKKGQPIIGAMDSVMKDGKNFYEKDYDDNDWETVSIPHQVNASDSFMNLGSNHGAIPVNTEVMFSTENILLCRQMRPAKKYL